MIAFWWRNGILSSEWCVLLTSNNVSNTAWRWQQNIYFILWWVSKTTAFLRGCQRERNYRQRERNYYSEFDGLAFGCYGMQSREAPRDSMLTKGTLVWLADTFGWFCFCQSTFLRHPSRNTTTLCNSLKQCVVRFALDLDKLEECFPMTNFWKVQCLVQWSVQQLQWYC